MLESLPDCTDVSQRAQIEALLLRNVDLFARHEYDVGLTNLMQYRLELKDPRAPPVCEPLRQHPIAYLDLIDNEVDKLLNAGLIVPCNSSWASNVVLVKRKTQPGFPARVRVTVDMRQANLRLRRLAYPMPNMSMIFNCLQGKRFISTLDFSNAYLSVPLDPETNYITAFVTRRGMFKFCRLAAGLASAPAVFNQLVQSLFRDLLWTEVLCFLDDLSLPSTTIDEGIALLEKVFDRLKTAGLKLKASKCKLLQTRVKILGFIVSEGQIEEDPERVAAIQSVPFPQTTRELRSFIGMCQFGRNFYKDLSNMLLPLTACLKKGARVVQTPETLRAFEQVKQAMSSAPVLTMFDPNARHIVECDASNASCGACLYQIGEDGVQKIVAYASKCFTDVQRRWCVTRRELFAIIFALRHWRHFLIGRPIVVRSDHSALRYLMSSKSLSSQWARYLDEIADYDIKVEWKPGREQRIADFLSRRPCDGASICKQCRPCQGDKVRNVYVNSSAGPGTRCIGQSVTESAEVNATPIVKHKPLIAPVIHADDGMRTSERCENQIAPLSSCTLATDALMSTLRRASAAGEVASGGTSAGAPASYADIPCSEAQRVARTKTSVPCFVPTVDMFVNDAIEPTDDLRIEAEITKFVAKSAVNTEARRVRTRAQTGDVQKRDGSRIDQLTRNALPIVPLNAWPIDEIIQNQSEDPVLSEVRQWLQAGTRPDGNTISADFDTQAYLRQYDSLILRDNLAYRVFLDVRGNVKHHQLLLPTNMRGPVLEHIHASVLCHAKTLRKNEAEVQRFAFWPTWKRDLRIFLAACRRCAEFHEGAPPRQGHLRPSASKLGGAGQILSIDLCGPLPTSNNFKFCLTTQDCFTKLITLTPLRNKTAEHVTHALIRVFLRHGFYPVLRCDNGGEFISDLQQQLDRLLGTVRLRTHPYTPRQNPVERSHRTINSMIAKTVDRHRNWSDILEYVAFCYNSTVHKASSFTPHFLHFGRELSNSVNLLLSSPVEEAKSYGEFATALIERMSFAFALARETLQGAALQANDITMPRSVL
jgi:hypothetical protein